MAESPGSLGPRGAWGLAAGLGALFVGIAVYRDLYLVEVARGRLDLWAPSAAGLHILGVVWLSSVGLAAWSLWLHAGRRAMARVAGASGALVLVTGVWNLGGGPDTPHALASMAVLGCTAALAGMLPAWGWAAALPLGAAIASATPFGTTGILASPAALHAAGGLLAVASAAMLAVKGRDPPPATDRAPTSGHGWSGALAVCAAGTVAPIAVRQAEPFYHALGAAGLFAPFLSQGLLLAAAAIACRSLWPSLAARTSWGPLALASAVSLAAVVAVATQLLGARPPVLPVAPFGFLQPVLAAIGLAAAGILVSVAMRVGGRLAWTGLGLLAVAAAWPLVLGEWILTVGGAVSVAAGLALTLCQARRFRALTPASSPK